ncbi:capsular polysaccharide synthesis protein [Enterocloster bolteae]|jgi:hypothetical protein|uniref:capsular polysaccharide synthesis protein n=1 Tax=Enterocloster bolteae TaxID=208479 RepID=UPI00210D6F49|nr:capsular polysaccharide synthesis protein [Enterocloster bolteae]MCQ5146272.1 capsular polysaccharide synthesis protein [Enterocloster bolteae]
MVISKFFEVWKNGELSWKLPKKLHLIKTYGKNYFHVKNKSLKELVIEDNCYRKLKKKYGSFINDYNCGSRLRTSNKTVWICWMQGRDDAPDLVKACINSIEEKLTDFNIVILNEKNINDYVTLPNHILEKYCKGKISKTHFSDILRVAILCEHGGLWLDSTVFCTDGLFAAEIIELPLFVYKVMNLDQNDEEAIMASSWLIAAKSNDPILLLARDLLYKYWKKHNYLINYFLLHLCFALAARKYRDEWNNIPMYNNRSPHTLMFELGNEFNENRWNEIKRMSSFHKLTRHVAYDREGTFYKHILKNVHRDK